ncbi:helix-turn-helix transcriptional regulator [Aureimonas sp. AU40]|uniref:helix-turn-helix transcriptional regulator n=1 Tax=Aureimonas sp. AU40 TaxID=1637747 RepID=UPI00078194AD|nr:PAS domain S-box protein [Aureimonas sp. AU40]
MANPKTETDPDRRQLHQLISGLRDGVILLGLDQRVLWANDAALTMHGAERIEDLGCDVDDYRKRFRLTYRNKHPVRGTGLSIEGVLAGEQSEPIVVEVRVDGTPDQSRVHALRFQVITKDDGEPDFVVLIVEDETARYDAEDRFESAFNANPAPAMICRIADQRHVRVNRGFLDMTGFSKDDVIGRTATEFDVLAGSRGRDEALERLHEGRTISQNEADLTLPDGSTKCVIVAGQRIELNDEPCMLFTFADLEPRRRAEKSLRQSEERFSKAFKLSPVASAISRLDGFRYVEVNAAFEDLTGYGSESVIGRSAPDLKLWTDPAARSAFEAAMTDVGSVRSFALELRRADGSQADCLLSAERIEIDDVPCVLSVISDVTDLKRTEVELVEAIDAVMTDATWFSQKIVERLAIARHGSKGLETGAGLEALSGREREVLELVCEGMTDAEISSTLNLSRHTVRNHLGSLYRKIRVARRSAAVVWARERGLTGRTASKQGKKRQK